MTLRIKNWDKYQHFKDRRPPWVKLYRDLLDDIEWHQLEPHAAKVLVMLWLIASEDDGELPSVSTLAFRLRMPEKDVLGCCSKLSHWVIPDDDELISACHQSDLPEKRQRREETEDRARDFARFYAAYPKKKAPADAEKAFAKVKVPVQMLLDALERQKQSEDWTKDKGRYIPFPATWLNQRRWEDQADAANDSSQAAWAGAK